MSLKKQSYRNDNTYNEPSGVDNNIVTKLSTEV